MVDLYLPSLRQVVVPLHPPCGIGDVFDCGFVIAAEVIVLIKDQILGHALLKFVPGPICSGDSATPIHTIGEPIYMTDGPVVMALPHTSGSSPFVNGRIASAMTSELLCSRRSESR